MRKKVWVISKYGSKKELILISFDFLQLMQIITITTTKYMKNASFSRCESCCFLVASIDCYKLFSCISIEKITLTNVSICP